MVLMASSDGSGIRSPLLCSRVLSAQNSSVAALPLLWSVVDFCYLHRKECSIKDRSLRPQLPFRCDAQGCQL